MSLRLERQPNRRTAGSEGQLLLMSHFFTPKSETHDGTTAFFEVDAANTDVYAYDMDSLANSHTPAMARLPTCLYTPCKSTFQPQNHETVRLPITLTERQ